MKIIKLTKNRFAVVDDADYDRVRKHVWYARKNQTGNWYAATTIRINGKRKQIHMHKFLLNIMGRYPLVDHVDRDGLNNRRCNLRISTHQQNTRHSVKRRGHYTSIHKGVCWSSSDRRWLCQVGLGNRKMYRKMFKNEIDAAKEYNRIAREVFGSYAILNDV